MPAALLRIGTCAGVRFRRGEVGFLLPRIHSPVIISGLYYFLAAIFFLALFMVPAADFGVP